MKEDPETNGGMGLSKLGWDYNQGVTLDLNSSNLSLVTEQGTTTLENIDGIWAGLNDTFIGDDHDNWFGSNAGTDTVTGGAGKIVTILEFLKIIPPM